MKALEILRDVFPKTPDIFQTEMEGHDQWIRTKMKHITEICTLIVHQGNLQARRPGLKDDLQDSLRFLDFLDDYVWEHLNIGHWKSIPAKWRTLKSIISLFKVVLSIGSDSDREVPVEQLIKICDQGLLLGSPFFLNNILAVLAERFHALIQPEITSNNQLQNNSKLKETTLVQLDGPRIETPRLENPPLEIFMSEHFQPEHPVILTGILESWPALKLWSPDYIVHIGGGRTVPVEIGSKYTSEDWTQKLMTIQEFVQKFMNEDQEQESSGKTRKKDIGYLAQYQLFDQLPELRKDIKFPDYCFVGGDQQDDDIEINAWFGPAHTLTPTHYDAKHNLLAQVFGSKFIRLFPPSESVNLYPHHPDSLLFNTSAIDMEDPLVSERFPNVRKASYSDLILAPGEVLYIPPKWWHAVQSLTPSFSVSFWFQ